LEPLVTGKGGIRSIEGGAEGFTDTGKAVNCVLHKVCVWNIIEVERVLNVDEIRERIVWHDFC
jgi:hypothetical protein